MPLRQFPSWSRRRVSHGIGYGESVIPWWGVIPFAIMLIAVATLPLLPATSHWWEKPEVQLMVSLLLGLPVALAMIAVDEGELVVHALIEYFQFVSLLFGLFVVAGGIALTGDLAGTPKVNTAFLAVGSVLASLIGTTGAAILLIRPMVRSNAHRRHRVHTVVFAIFTLANCGGLLTPLGDPPLFLGLLRGVPFSWTLHLWPQWLLVNGLLLVTYYCLDRALMVDEDPSRDIVEPLGVRGGGGVIWFIVIIAAVALVPSVDVEAVQAGQATWPDYLPWRELIILGAAWLAWRTGDKVARFKVNRFSWGPIAEVAAIFVGIFLTMIPALRLLDQRAGGLPLSPITLHLFTGGLSAVLDNAPTYATFFEVAANSSLARQPGVALVAGVPEVYLVAVSTGAVLWGAMTYIGNGPNFMVRSIAESAGVRMPSFVGYMAWSARWLLPCLLAAVLIFSLDHPVARWCGWGLVVLLLLRAALLFRGRGLGLPQRPPTPSARL
ncbi:MAG: sodium:proton antiporter [Propionibacteriaceae bacterium]|jgi:Na+/H+ antiporter NhaD/arsenite permease-like protein|nr:sodium:proton antiporter [Propionibacteriaceae bacterium]